MKRAQNSEWTGFWNALTGGTGSDAASPGSLETSPSPAPEHDVLDGLDWILVRTLQAKLNGQDDAFKAVTAYLLSVMKAGGLRIPVSEPELAVRLRDFFRGVFLSEAHPLGSGEKTAVEELAGSLAKEFVRRLEAGGYAAVIGGSEFKPLMFSKGYLYFQKYLAAEAAVSLRLKTLLSAPEIETVAETGEGPMDAVLARFPLRLSPSPGAAPVSFNPEQKRALAQCLRQRFLVISGGPGTGKTSLAANLLRLLSRARGLRPDRIRLAAPTGRAARRLAESLRKSLASVDYASDATGEAQRVDRALLDVPCETLHKLLRMHPVTGVVRYGKARTLPVDLLVVDETSMVDIFTLARLLEALPENAQLILLGDMHQLPSVDAGAVLADLVPDDADAPLRDHLALLAETYRSEAGILAVAGKINVQDGAGALNAMSAPATLGAFENGCRMLAAPGGNFRAGRDAWLDAWTESHYLSKSSVNPEDPAYGDWVKSLSRTPGGDRDPGAFSEALEHLFAGIDRARILTVTRKSWYGCEAANRRLRGKLKPLWDAHGFPTGEGFHGAPILILENDYSRDLFNGETGVLLRDGDGYRAYFRREGEYLSYPERFLPRYELAFAITVHKSQGSEYDRVLLMLPEAGNRLLSKEILYTALTRARSFAGVYGAPEVFLEAAARKVMRDSGLADYLETPPPS